MQIDKTHKTVLLLPQNFFLQISINSSDQEKHIKLFFLFKLMTNNVKPTFELVGTKKVVKAKRKKEKKTLLNIMMCKNL